MAANNSTLFRIFDDLTATMKTVVQPQYIFLKNRPDTNESSDKKMSKFAVVDLPSNIEDAVIGNKKTLLNTYGVFYLFVKARNNDTLDVNDMGDFVDNVHKLFPIKGKCCTAANPTVMLRGSDGHGYQVVSITFDLQTKWKVFD